MRQRESLPHLNSSCCIMSGIAVFSIMKKGAVNVDSIMQFWGQMTGNPLLFMAVTLTLGVILVNGWTDAPNAIATCVVTRCMPPKAAILMAALFNFLGVFVMTLLNATVAETITKMVDFGACSRQSGASGCMAPKRIRRSLP